jgi:hypothetical protein
MKGGLSSGKKGKRSGLAAGLKKLKEDTEKYQAELDAEQENRKEAAEKEKQLEIEYVSQGRLNPKENAYAFGKIEQITDRHYNNPNPNQDDYKKEVGGKRTKRKSKKARKTRRKKANKRSRK